MVADSIPREISGMTRRKLRKALALGVVATAAIAAALVVVRQDRPDIAGGEEHPTVQPLTPRVTAELSFKGAGGFDLDASKSGIWVAAHNGREEFRTRLLNVDPLRNRVEETGLVLGAFHTPAEVETRGDDIWVRGDELIKIDAATQKVLL